MTPRQYAIVGWSAAATLAVLLGWMSSQSVVGTAVSSDSGLTALFALGVLSIVGLRNRSLFIFGRLDPAAQLVSAVLSFTFAGGVLFAGEALGSHRSYIATLFAITVIAFVGGASLIPTPARAKFRFGSGFPDATLGYFRYPVIRGIIVGVFFIAALNFITGKIPLFAESINSVRFNNGGGGAFHQLWSWLIGAFEWFAIAACVKGVALRSLTMGEKVLACAASAIMLLLAGRSFLFLVAVAVVLAVLTLRRVSLVRLLIVGLLLLVALGSFASYRSQHSIGAGETGKSSSVEHLLRQSFGIGPSVFASTLDVVPSYLPFQHGYFVWRDFASNMPLHPLGRPETSDYWVTRDVRHRLTSGIGGSPPYVDGRPVY